MALPITTRFYRYLVESLDILFPDSGERYQIDQKLVRSIMFERDYENDIFPVIRLDLSLDTDIYHKIIAFSTTVKFRLRVQKFAYDENNTMLMRKDYINASFVIFLDENTPFLNESEFKAASEVSSTSSSSGKTPITVGGNEVSFYLFKDQDLIGSKQRINTVLTEVSMSDTIAYLLSTAGFNKILLTPLENLTVYKEVIIPPFVLTTSLRYLENQFGFYKTGAVVFFDVDCVYIIDRNKRCSAWRRGENTKTMFTVKDSMNADKFSSGSYFDEQQSTTFINIDPKEIQMNSGTVVRDQIDGNHLMIINGYEATTQNIRTNVRQRGDGTYKLVINKYNNEYITNTEKRKIESDTQSISIPLKDIDIDTLTPNKEFIFKFEDSKIQKVHGGPYRLTNSTTFLLNEGDHFKIKTTATFKK